MRTFPKPLGSKEEEEYLKQAQNGNKEARRILIEHNLRLVAHIVKKYHISDSDVDDLISIGTIGLIKAVDSFNAEKGIRLATYASRCIDNELLMMLRNKKKISREISLYEPIGTDKEGNEISLLNIIESDEEDIVDKIEQKKDIKNLYALVNEVLSEREKEIIHLRYGLQNKKEITQREIAAKMGISRSYVSRIENKALIKLRDAFQKINGTNEN